MSILKCINKHANCHIHREHMNSINTAAVAFYMHSWYYDWICLHHAATMLRLFHFNQATTLTAPAYLRVNHEWPAFASCDQDTIIHRHTISRQSCHVPLPHLYWTSQSTPQSAVSRHRDTKGLTTADPAAHKVLPAVDHNPTAVSSNQCRGVFKLCNNLMIGNFGDGVACITGRQVSSSLC